MAATDMQATTEELLEAVFSVQSMLRLHNEGQLHYKRVLGWQLESRRLIERTRAHKLRTL
jgi:hypothetical protein